MLKVGVVGLGNIAAGYSGPEDAAPYTHAGGINHSSKVQLAAVADLSKDAREEFRAKWGGCFPNTGYYHSFEDMLAAGGLDIVTICIRGPHHHAALLEAIKAGPKAIFLEKPPTCSLAEMDEVISAAKATDIPITVSYSRHWGPHVLRMSELIRDGLIGKVTSVVGYCGGSFLSFSSHTTDMICQFSGYCPVAVFAGGTVPTLDVPDGYEPEPELLSMVIEFENGLLGTQIGHEGEHGSFYCDVVGTEGRACVPFYGSPSARDKEGKEIDLEEHAMPAQASPFKLAYEQIADHLGGGALPDCTDDSFVAVHEIGFAGIESVLTNQRVEIPNENRTRRIFANG
jgi:predicted dehydrogenase